MQRVFPLCSIAYKKPTCTCTHTRTHTHTHTNPYLVAIDYSCEAHLVIAHASVARIRDACFCTSVCPVHMCSPERLRAADGSGATGLALRRDVDLTRSTEARERPSDTGGRLRGQPPMAPVFVLDVPRRSLTLTRRGRTQSNGNEVCVCGGYWGGEGRGGGWGRGGWEGGGGGGLGSPPVRQRNQQVPIQLSPEQCCITIMIHLLLFLRISEY